MLNPCLHHGRETDLKCKIFTKSSSFIFGNLNHFHINYVEKAKLTDTLFPSNMSAKNPGSPVSFVIVAKEWNFTSGALCINITRLHRKTHITLG